MGFGDIEKFYETYQILNDTKVVACRTMNTVVNKWTNVQYILTALPLYPEYRFSKANQELGVLALCSSHANLVHLEDFYCEGNYLYIITEKLNYGSLRDYLLLNGPVTEQFAAKIIKGIAEGLCHLHQCDIAHRNLKFENIFCSNDEKLPVKLSGFEMAVRNEEHLRENNDDMLSNFLTTPSYLAPEVAMWFFKIKGFYSKQCDMWNLGAIMFEILAGTKPYTNSGICSCCTNDSCYLCLKAIFTKIVEGSLDKLISWNHISSEARDLISKLLETDPVKRYTPEKVLQHPWIQKYFMTFEEKYICTDKVLGGGMSGNVTSIIEKSTTKEFALKTVNTTRGCYLASMEKKILTLVLGHQNFIQMKDCYMDSKFARFVLEKMNNGSLCDKLSVGGPFIEREAARVIKDVAVALKFLHQLNIAHRDVKPDNILFSNEGSFAIKLVDFGLSASSAKENGSKVFSYAAGTLSYMAPEVAKWYINQKISYSYKCDMWSLGVVMVEILTGQKPFAVDAGDCSDRDSNRFHRILAICRGKYSLTGVSDEAKDLASKLLTKDPDKRYTANQVLEHNWIKNNV